MVEKERETKKELMEWLENQAEINERIGNGNEGCYVRKTSRNNLC